MIIVALWLIGAHGFEPGEPVGWTTLTDTLPWQYYELNDGRTTVVGIADPTLVITILYAMPWTAVLGAILMTGYLGGAIAIHVRAQSGLFPAVFSTLFGVLAWVGLILREPCLLRTILLRQ